MTIDVRFIFATRENQSHRNKINIVKIKNIPNFFFFFCFSRVFIRNSRRSSTKKEREKERVKQKLFRGRPRDPRRSPPRRTVLDWQCFQCNGGGHAGKSAPRPLVAVAFKKTGTRSRRFSRRTPTTTRTRTRTPHRSLGSCDACPGMGDVFRPFLSRVEK